MVDLLIEATKSQNLVEIGLTTDKEIDESFDVMTNDEFYTWMVTRLFCSH